MTFPPPSGARAGWYPDPYGQPWARYYDGHRWTHHQSQLGQSHAGYQQGGQGWSTPVEHPTLPFPVVIGAVLILAGSLIGSRPLLDTLIDRDWPVPLLMTFSVVVGYAPSVLWLWFVSKRWGSGHPFADFGVRFRWVDLGWGPLVWISTLFGMGITLQIVKALDIPYRGNLDLSLTAMFAADVNRTAVVSLVVSTVLFAPIIEEAIFRGAVLRGLLSTMPAVPAVALQGVLFGGAHFNPDFGRDSIGLMIVLAVAGIGFGLAAFLLRRIGPTIIAHAILNGVAITVALAQET